MGFITLIKTAEENPTGFTVISSVKIEEYTKVECLFEILTKKLYSFVIHGKDSGIRTLETDFTSNEAVFEFLSKNWVTFKNPGTRHITKFNPEILAEFTYKCGYEDRWHDDNPRKGEE